MLLHVTRQNYSITIVSDRSVSPGQSKDWGVPIEKVDLRLCGGRIATCLSTMAMSKDWHGFIQSSEDMVCETPGKVSGFLNKKLSKF